MQADTSELEQILIDRVEQLARDGHVSEASRILRQALATFPTSLTVHNRLEELGVGHLGEWFGIDCQIHPQDDIFRFFMNHPASLNPIRDYLCDGWRTMTELLFIMDDMGVSLGKQGRCLEFASGFGRLTRHWSRWLSRHGNRLTVADVVPGSVDYLKQRFRVDGFYSAEDPAQLEVPGRFDLIFVLSLFSHLPDATWGRWLKRLFEGLNPGGVLIFSAHGLRSAETQGVVIPDSGFLFMPSSESAALDGATYGTTFSSPAYVRDVLRRELGEVVWREYPGYFWSHQDAYAVRRE